jgi:hypothetical protein
VPYLNAVFYFEVRHQLFVDPFVVRSGVGCSVHLPCETQLTISVAFKRMLT